MVAREALMIAVFSICGLGLFILAVRAYRRNQFTLLQAPLVFVGHLLCRVYWQLEIRGEFEDPGSGAVLVCNHRSPFDPIFIQAGLRRLSHWMVAKEYCESRLFGWFLRLFEVIPTSRSGLDTGATKKAIALAKEGELVGLLPEGRINTSDRLLMPGRPGAVLVALKAGVPIIPFYIEGGAWSGSVLRSLFTPERRRLTVGKPLDFSEYFDQHADKEVQRKLTLEVLQAIAALAGQPDYQPQLAGRDWKPAEDEE